MYNILKPPITAHFIRILPLEWHNHISLRIEIYGCPGIPKYFQIVITVTRNLLIKPLVNLPGLHQHSAAAFFSFQHQSLLGQKFKLCMVKIMWHLNKQTCHIKRNKVAAPLAMLSINWWKHDNQTYGLKGGTLLDNRCFSRIIFYLSTPDQTNSGRSKRHKLKYGHLLTLHSTLSWNLQPALCNLMEQF